MSPPNFWPITTITEKCDDLQITCENTIPKSRGWGHFATCSSSHWNSQWHVGNPGGDSNWLGSHEIECYNTCAWNLNFMFASVLSITLRVFLSRIGSERMSWSWGILSEPASDLTLALDHGTSSLRWDVCEHNHLAWIEIPFSSRNCVNPPRQKALRVMGTTEANMKSKIYGLQTAMKDTVSQCIHIWALMDQ